VTKARAVDSGEEGLATTQIRGARTGLKSIEIVGDGQALEQIQSGPAQVLTICGGGSKSRPSALVGGTLVPDFGLRGSCEPVRLRSCAGASIGWLEADWFL